MQDLSCAKRVQYALKRVQFPACHGQNKDALSLSITISANSTSQSPSVSPRRKFDSSQAPKKKQRKKAYQKNRNFKDPCTNSNLRTHNLKLNCFSELV